MMIAMNNNRRIERVGIYAGTFDPVHAGHLAFALQALQAAKLDKVYFLPERRPRGKNHVEHFGHRVAMLKQAARPHPQFDVLELPDVSFTVRQTLPRLREQLGGSQLFFLFGSDVIDNLPDWPLAERLISEHELIIGLRGQDDQAAAQQAIANWPIPSLAVTLINSHAPDVSSGKIRESLRQGKPAAGSLTSVARYSNQHWLYVQLADPVDTA
jgi:nicotinate-nucleotide adenylyltransferase